MNKPTDFTSDHDTLVTLAANFNTFTRQYTIDMKELKDGYSLKFTDHELRLKAIEKTHEEINPLQITAEFRAVQQQVHDFFIVWKFMIGVIAFMGFGSIMTLLAQSLKIFR